MSAVARQRQTRANADLEHAALAAIDDLDRMLASGLGNLAEGEIIDRRPTAIGVAHGAYVHNRCSRGQGYPLPTLQDRLRIGPNATRPREPLWRRFARAPE